MTINKIDPQDRQARDIALCLVESEDTEVTAADVQKWQKWDVYEWIEAFGYMWDEQDQEWVFDD